MTAGTTDTATKKNLLVELKHGRISMLVTMGYMTQKIMSGSPEYPSTLPRAGYQLRPHRSGNGASSSTMTTAEAAAETAAAAAAAAVAAAAAMVVTLRQWRNRQHN